MTLIEIIKHHGYTVNELAKELAVSPTQINRWNREGILTNNRHYPILKEMFPEIKGKEPANANMKGGTKRELYLTDTDVHPPPEEIPTSSPLPTEEELKILEE